jgi:anti-sigma factor RsiW
MRCEAAERELSARLDDGGDRRAEDRLDEHLATCSRCRAFEARARRLREVVRLEPAAEVPDLVPAIMAEVRREAVRGRRPIRLPRPSGQQGWGHYAAAFVAGALVAAVALAGLPGLRRGPQPALAGEIPDRVASASTQVTAYRATFDVVERNFHPRVPERRFAVEVAFRAPERFRAVVSDATAYPAGSWPRNDLALAVDGDRWMLRGPVTCPRQGLPLCAAGEVSVQRVTGREPFDGDAPLPTDIVLPVGTLSGTDRVDVVGTGEVLGREVVIVELAYRDATPLFGYLQAAGLWRPLFPQDRVLVSLDAENWFPLAYEVRAAASPDRGRWALQHVLPIEHPGTLLLSVEARSFRPSVARQPALAPAPTARDEGFRDLPESELAAVAGRVPAVPTELAGLRPYRAGTFVGPGRPDDEVLLSFSRGLAWLKIRQTGPWPGPQLFGDMSDLAVPVELAGGVAYYDPASATLGRRLAIHAPGMDLYLESNLPRDDLMRVAGSIPVRGIPIPEDWLVRRSRGDTLELQATLSEARSAVPGLTLPRDLPPSYGLRTIHIHRGEAGTAVAVYFRRPGAELDGVGIRIYQAPGQELAPPLDPDALRVRVDGVTARYTPSRGLLEWVADGTYRSLTAQTLDLASLLAVARSWEAA